MKQRIIEDFLTNPRSMAEIARKYGVTANTVSKYITDAINNKERFHFKEDVIFHYTRSFEKPDRIIYLFRDNNIEVKVELQGTTYIASNTLYKNEHEFVKKLLTDDDGLGGM
ncbi:MAG TPA: hypothetical protein VFM82_03585 [Flavobacteriaceae bacterium]|nr:hypothetical protein [Flavobacteriaceae bacterium]